MEIGADEALRLGYITVHNYPRIVASLDLYRVRNLSKFEAEDCRGVWLYGLPGTGKSHYAKLHYPDAFRKNQNKWFDGYTTQKNIILDDLDNHVLAHHLKIWCDKWSCTGEVKGSTIELVHENFVITSNYAVDELFPIDHSTRLKEKASEQLMLAVLRRVVVHRFDDIYVKGSNCVDHAVQNDYGMWIHTLIPGPPIEAPALIEDPDI